MPLRATSRSTIRSTPGDEGNEGVLMFGGLAVSTRRVSWVVVSTWFFRLLLCEYALCVESS